MDPQTIRELIELGPYGISTLLIIALGFCVRLIIKLYAEKDNIRLTQLSDLKIALEAVSKSTDNLNNAEERMTEQTAVLKEWVIVTRAQQGRGN